MNDSREFLRQEGFAKRLEALSPEKRILLQKRLQKHAFLETTANEPIAIIGMACRFPGGANDPEAFWKLLSEGRDAISEITEDRWRGSILDKSNMESDEYEVLRWGGFVDAIDEYDAAFFDTSPREAATMDPQQRMVMEVACEALESAGQPWPSLAGSDTGIFIGLHSQSSDYYWLQLNAPGELDMHAATGGSHSIAANRLSYFLDLRGPSMAIDTACSSSLVAVHLACQSLRSGECSMALAGGVNLILSQENSFAYSKLQFLSPDGRCKTFDARANGYVRGEGCGVIVLRSLKNAIIAGDPIMAIIRGTAVNQDGATNGLTAPNGLSQKAVLQRALKNAGVEPDRITFIETHGTGTALGDPIEVESISAVMGPKTSDEQICYLGAVKSNIGHLEAAAGIAGIIKTVLCMQHQSIPANLHFKKLNPHISLKDTRFRIPIEMEKWVAKEGERFAGVSSFGFGGTNSHVVLQEASRMPAANHFDEGIEAELPRGYLLSLSARSDEALAAMGEKWQGYLSNNDVQLPSLQDICYTASVRRTHHDHRYAVVCRGREELIESLKAFKESRATVGTGASTREDRSGTERLVFVFSGQGPQWFGMGRQLLEKEPVYREMIEHCGKLLERYARWSLLDELRADESSSRMNQSEIAQPALFALQMGLAALWHSWGIEPDAVVGHSVGEVAAACVGGVLSIEDAIQVVYHRGRILQRATGLGRMAAADISQEVAERIIADYQERLSVAAINSPMSVTLSGERDALENVLSILKRQNVFCRMLPVNYAYHSIQIEPFRQEMTKSAAGIETKPTKITVMSTVSGKPGENMDFGSEYWAENIRRPVRFAEAIDGLILDGHTTFVEIGPHPVLFLSISQCLSHRNAKGKIFPSLRRGECDKTTLLETLGGLYTQGWDVKWNSLYSSGGRCVQLPSYPWQRKRYWIPQAEGDQPLRFKSAKGRLLTGDRQERRAERFYDITWLAKQHTVTGEADFQSAFIPSPDQIVDAVLPEYQRLSSRDELIRYKILSPQLDALCLAYVLRAFRQLGWKPHVNQPFTIHSLIGQLGIIEQHRRLTGRLLEMLQEEGVLESVDDHWLVRRLPEMEDPVQLYDRLQKTYAAFDAELVLLERCGNRLADILRGDCDAVQLLFPEGSLASTEKLYQGSPIFSAWNRLVQTAVSQASQCLPEGRKLKILEIGAGTGATTAEVLRGLTVDRTEYTFTDVSNVFLSKAQAKFRDYPYLRYSLLDIEKDPEMQGLPAGRFDVILAANVLHATSDLQQTLVHIKRLLAPKGLLVLLEVTARVRWIDLIFGLTAGWWRYADVERRPSYPLLSRTNWLQLLEQQGFNACTTIPGASIQYQDEFPHAIIMARKPAAERQSKPVQHVAAPTGQPSGWLVFADRVGIGQVLVERIRAQGHTCVLVLPDETYQAPAASVAYINPLRCVDFERLLQDTVTSGRISLAGIVHLWGLDTGELDRARPAFDPLRLTGSVLHLTQGLMKGKANGNVHLWIVTRGVLPLGETEHPLSLGQAPLWGLGRVIGLEKPELWGGLVDLDPADRPEVAAERLFAEICNPDGEDQIAFRGRQRFVARLERAKTLPGEGRPAILRPDGAYLITGGLGRLGLKVAHWMVTQGARYLVLLGRKGIPAPAERESLSSGSPTVQTTHAIHSIERLGASVKVIAADVSDTDQMTALLAQFGKTHPPLRGVIHAAATMEMIALQDLDLKALESTFKPKVMGAWALHQLTREMDLDFFVLFSSGAALWGSKDLAHYAAANAFLDSLAHYRRRNGLPALSINWGWWAGGGTSQTAERYFRQIGLNPMSDDECLASLSDLISAGEVQKAVSNFDWRIFGPILETKKRRPFLERLLIQRQSDEKRLPKESLDFLRQLEEAAAVQRRDILLKKIQALVAQILRYGGPELLDTKQGFFSMGMDSIMALQLKNRIEASLGRRLPQTVAFEHPNIEALTDFLATEVLSLALPEQADVEPHASEKETVVQHGVEMQSEEDLVELLSRKLKGLGKTKSIE